MANAEVDHETHFGKLRDLGTREGYLAAIRDSGQFIIDHAEGLLGEYPGALLSEMSITASFRFDCVPTLTVTREHIVPPCFDGKEG